MPPRDAEPVPTARPGLLGEEQVELVLEELAQQGPVLAVQHAHVQVLAAQQREDAVGGEGVGHRGGDADRHPGARLAARVEVEVAEQLVAPAQPPRGVPDELASSARAAP
jgi:hypothetical protein